MDNGVGVTEKARQVSISLYSKHDALLYALRMQRAEREREIPKVSDLFQEAITELARRELDPAQFEDLIAGVA
jgi:cell division protein FtsB